MANPPAPRPTANSRETWTVEEVRVKARRLHDEGWQRTAAMLYVYADRLEDDERSRAVAQNLIERLHDVVQAMKQEVEGGR